MGSSIKQSNKWSGEMLPTGKCSRSFSLQYRLERISTPEQAKEAGAIADRAHNYYDSGTCPTDAFLLSLDVDNWYPLYDILEYFSIINNAGVVGQCGIYRLGDECYADSGSILRRAYWLGWLSVDYEHRRRGLGSLAIIDMIKLAIEKNGDYFGVLVDTPHGVPPKYIQLYEKFGFSIIPESDIDSTLLIKMQEWYSPDKIDLYFMLLRLSVDTLADLENMRRAITMAKSLHQGGP
jgi:GNAT superfamily N-acetyltransferase